MVDVLVRDEDRVNVLQRKVERGERLRDAAAGNAGVDQNMGVFVADERGVARARAGDGVKFHGSFPLFRFIEIIPQARTIVKKKKPSLERARGKKKRAQDAGKARPAMKPFSPVQTISPAATTPSQT